MLWLRLVLRKCLTSNSRTSKKAIEGFSNISENIDKENLKGLQRQMKIDEVTQKAKLGLNKEEESGETKAAPDKAKEEIEKGETQRDRSLQRSLQQCLVGNPDRKEYERHAS